MEPHYHRKIIFLTNQGWNYDTKKSVDQHFLKFDWLALFDIKKKKIYDQFNLTCPTFELKKKKRFMVDWDVWNLITRSLKKN